MSERRLGGRDVTVSAVGQGTMGVGGTFARDEQNDAACIRSLQAGFDLGMRFVDTAPGYGAGHAEELVGRAVTGRRSSVVIATKFPPTASTRGGLIASVEASLRRMRTDYVDLLQVHWPCYDVPVDETLDTMRRLVEVGKARFLGLGNCTAAETLRALATPAGEHIVSVQQEYSLLERSVETHLLPECRARELTLIAYSPLAVGRLAADLAAFPIAVVMAERYGLSVSQLALAWLLQEQQVIAIPKASSLSHLRANAATASVRLDPADRERLGAAFSQPTRCVPPEEIVVEHEQGRPVYTTLAEARANALGIHPGPAELARQMSDGEMLKPIKIRPMAGNGKTRFRLTEGRTRYWGWVIAHGDTPIPAVIEGGDASRGA